MAIKQQDPLDAVRRALIAAECRVVAERTQMPEAVVMSLAEGRDWNVQAAEAAINDTMKDVADSLLKSSEAALFGGGPGGGKSDFQYRVETHYGAEVIGRQHFGVIKCAS
jgi:hypothetical protein